MLRLAARSSSLAARGASLSRRRSSSLSLPGVARRLGEVAKVELFEAEAPDRISAIWDSFHEDRPELAGCSVTAEEHLKITERARESPLFIFPVRREQGHFMLLSQFNAQSDMFVMTFLEDYKQNRRRAAVAQRDALRGPADVQGGGPATGGHRPGAALQARGRARHGAGAERVVTRALPP
jgi:hypothetical protein